MSIQDISWGSVILGAGVAIGLTAVALASGGALASVAILAENQALTLAGAGVVGGVAGEFVSDLFGRAKDAGAAITR